MQRFIKLMKQNSLALSLICFVARVRTCVYISALKFYRKRVTSDNPYNVEYHCSVSNTVFFSNFFTHISSMIFWVCKNNVKNIPIQVTFRDISVKTWKVSFYGNKKSIISWIWSAYYVKLFKFLWVWIEKKSYISYIVCSDLTQKCIKGWHGRCDH